MLCSKDKLDIHCPGYLSLRGPRARGLPAEPRGAGGQHPLRVRQLRLGRRQQPRGAGRRRGRDQADPGEHGQGAEPGRIQLRQGRQDHGNEAHIYIFTSTYLHIY